MVNHENSWRKRWTGSRLSSRIGDRKSIIIKKKDKIEKNVVNKGAKYVMGSWARGVGGIVVGVNKFSVIIEKKFYHVFEGDSMKVCDKTLGCTRGSRWPNRGELLLHFLHVERFFSTFKSQLLLFDCWRVKTLKKHDDKTRTLHLSVCKIPLSHLANPLANYSIIF